MFASNKERKATHSNEHDESDEEAFSDAQIYPSISVHKLVHDAYLNHSYYFTLLIQMIDKK